MGEKTVFISIGVDILYEGHVKIIQRAAALGKLTVGVLTDEAMAGYKRSPLLSYEKRRAVVEAIKGVDRTVAQESVSGKEYILSHRPDYVVHGDEWKSGPQSAVREECLRALETYGGELVEYPYSEDAEYTAIEQYARGQLSIPDMRRGRLKKLLQTKPLITAIEAHSGLSGLIAEKTVVYQNGKGNQFDAMWVSSLCDSTLRGKPDIELVDMTSRMRTIDEIMDVTTKPIIFDGDTGGQTEHFVYTVRTLERMGVSMIIIEDKTGLKKNSLFGTEVEQSQDTIEHFCEKIRAGKQAQKTREFMIVARIESLILEKGEEDALKRAFAYVDAGADGIMIHSRKTDPAEIFSFVETFRKQDKDTTLVVVPSSFRTVTEQEFMEWGVNVVIYANQLTRSMFPAMKTVAETILTHHRAEEAEPYCMSLKEIINLIPEDL